MLSRSFTAFGPKTYIRPSGSPVTVSDVFGAVQLQASNSISVQVRGKPGGELAVEIIGIDNDAPAITASLSPTPNPSGWNNSPVTITFSCSDLTPGVQSCPSAITASREGLGRVFTGQTTDFAGNTSTATVSVNIDMSAPSGAALVTPATNSFGWNNSSVNISYSCGEHQLFMRRRTFRRGELSRAPEHHQRRRQSGSGRNRARSRRQCVPSRLGY